MRRTIGMAAAVAGVCASSAMAQIDRNPWPWYDEMYEMNYSPTTTEGTAFGHVMAIADLAGGGVNGAEGFTYADGIATFLDNGSSHGNQGLVTTKVANTVPTTPPTT